MSFKMRNPVLFFILILSLLGILDSLMLLDIKYGDGHVACDLGGSFSCTDVNNSEYADIFGFPVAGLGLIGYSILFFISLLLFKEYSFRRKNLFPKLYDWFATPVTLFTFATVAFLIQSVFTLLEIFVLKAYCIYCLISQLLILLIFALSYYYYFEK